MLFNKWILLIYSYYSDWHICIYSTILCVLFVFLLLSFGLTEYFYSFLSLHEFRIYTISSHMNHFHHSFLQLRSSIWNHFPSAWNTSFWISFRESLLVLHTWKELAGFAYLKITLFALILEIFAVYGILHWHIFSYHFEDTMSLPSGSTVVIDKSAVTLLWFWGNLLKYFIVFWWCVDLLL